MTPTNWQTRLAAVNACTKARDWCAGYPATREGSTAAAVAAWAMGDVVRAHLDAGEVYDALMGGRR